MFPTFLPMWSMHIRVNSNPPNQMFIAVPPSNQVENGEMQPLTTERASKKRASAQSKPLESSMKQLQCCLLWNPCGAMDGKVVKFAKRVLNEKEIKKRKEKIKKTEKQKQHENDQRMTRMEKNIKIILTALMKPTDEKILDLRKSTI
jgi:hypothetical protein